MYNLFLILSAVSSFSLGTYSLVSCESGKIQIIDATSPKYPLHSPNGFVSGFVDIQLIVDSHGKVQEHQIIRSQPKRVFDRSAIKAVKKWNLEPSKEAKRCFKTRIDFVLSN